MKVSEKGALSIYGMGRFPVTSGTVATRSGRTFRDQRGVGGKVAATVVQSKERRAEAARREHFAAGEGCGPDFVSDC